jgi:carbon monoxide dehydrogenase subunit G
VAIEIKETFQVSAPIEEVWQFVMDPNKVVTCMPGAALDEVVDERTFDGSIKVKVGAVMAAYKGRVQLTEVDEANFVVRMSAEGREKGGGTAKGLMTSRLSRLEGGATEVLAEASVDLTGKIMQVGRGMIQGVSHQLFQQFVSRIRANLEPAAGDGGNGSVPAGAGAGPAAPAHDEAIAIIPLILKTIWTAIVNFFRRLFGRQPK